MTQLQLVNSLGKNTTALILCETASSNSWMSNSLAKRLGLHGKAMKLTVRGSTTEEVVDTKLFELTATPHDNQSFELFELSLM